MAISFKKILVGTVGLSLAASAVVGATLFFLPAALAAVASFSVYGLSIAGIVGANALLQIGFTAGLAFAATSVVSSFATALFNTASWIKDACFKPKAGAQTPSQDETTSEDRTSSLSAMRNLGRPSTPAADKPAEEPIHSTLLASKAAASNEPVAEPEATSTATI